MNKRRNKTYERRVKKCENVRVPDDAIRASGGRARPEVPMWKTQQTTNSIITKYKCTISRVTDETKISTFRSRKQRARKLAVPPPLSSADLKARETSNGSRVRLVRVLRSCIPSTSGLSFSLSLCPLSPFLFPVPPCSSAPLDTPPCVVSWGTNQWGGGLGG